MQRQSSQCPQPVLSGIAAGGGTIISRGYMQATYSFSYIRVQRQRLPGQRHSAASLAALQVPAPSSAAASSSRSPLRRWRAISTNCIHSQEMHSSSGHYGTSSKWAPQIQVGVNVGWTGRFRVDGCKLGYMLKQGSKVSAACVGWTACSGHPPGPC